MWCLQESNQGHTDFQSVALPTELRHLFHKKCKYKVILYVSQIIFLNYYVYIFAG